MNQQGFPLADYFRTGQRTPQIVVTAENSRPLVHQLAAELAGQANVYGAPVQHSFSLPVSQAALSYSVSRAAWIIFTSARAVTYWPSPTQFPGPLPRVATVGAATAQAAETASWTVHLVGTGSAQRLLDVFPTPPPSTTSPTPPPTTEVSTSPKNLILLPGSAQRTPGLATGLRLLGWRVETINTYTVEPVAILPDCYRSADIFVATSGSNLRAWHSLWWDKQIDYSPNQPQHSLSPNQPQHLPIFPHSRFLPHLICLGQPTARIAAELDIPVTAVAANPTATALAEAIRSRCFT